MRLADLLTAWEWQPEAGGNQRQRQLEPVTWLQLVAGPGSIFFGELGVLSDQCNERVLLAVSELAKALQKLSLVKRQLWAVEPHAQIFIQCAFLQQALLQSGDDF